MFPETEEEFTLSLMKGEGTEDLNVFPSTSVVTMTILDDDGMYFMSLLLVVSCKGKMPRVRLLQPSVVFMLLGWVPFFLFHSFCTLSASVLHTSIILLRQI